jgi:hypothetical protein
MPEHLLDAEDVAPVAQEEKREGVAASMGVPLLGLCRFGKEQRILGLSRSWLHVA